MKNTKFVLAAVAALGAIAVFLPYVPLDGGEAMSFWAFREIETVGAQPIIALVCFLGALAFAGISIATKGLTRGLAIPPLLFSLLTLVVEGVRKGFAEGTAIGGKLLLLSAIAALVTSIVAVAKPEPRR